MKHLQERGVENLFTHMKCSYKHTNKHKEEVEKLLLLLIIN